VLSALVIPASDAENGDPHTRRGLMHSYHNVAELRQMRGVQAVNNSENRSILAELVVFLYHSC
jgi:hypothetical protein